MKKIFLIIAACFACALSSFAYSFNAGGLYYYILGGDSVEVTYGSQYDGFTYNINGEYWGFVTIPSTVNYYSTTYRVTTIDDYAFHGCSSLTAVTIPNSVTTIGDDAFYGCSNLAKVNYTGTIDSWCTIQFGDNPLHLGANFYLNDIKVVDLILPQGLTTIDNWFEGCKSIRTLIIPESVTTIRRYAFRGCSSLTSITIPNSVTNIGYSAFSGCSSLTEVTIGESVTTIDTDAFRGCSSLAEVTIPNSVTNIGNDAFSYCSKLTAITWNAKNCISASFSSSIASQITSFTFGNEVEHIPAYLCYDMSSLTSITIGESVTTIGDYAFYGCSSLRDVTIGNSVTTIGDYAFKDCTGLLTLSIGADTPPLVESSTFTNVSTTAIIKVPCGASDLYKAASYWNSFTNYQESSLYNFSAKSANKTQGKVTIHQQPDCESDGVAIFEAVPYQGYEFAGWNDGNTETYRIVEVIEDVEYTAHFISTTAGEKMDSVVVNPSDHSADFIWPVIEGAQTYVFVIYADEAHTEKICTVTCNKFGQLTNLDFARSKPATNQEVPSGLLNFTITGLESSTTYGYTLDAYNADEALIKRNAGAFTTTNSAITGVDTPLASPEGVRKVLENGTIYILRNGEKYTIDGRRII